MKDTDGVTYSDLTEDLPDDLRPKIDQAGATWYHSSQQRQFMSDGVVELKQVIPTGLIDRYCEVRKQYGPAGWRSPTPYMQIPVARDLGLYHRVISAMNHLIGEPMGMHLNLTGWVSTERKWHQDSYLNPSFVGGHYIAAWFALDDIHPDSGPFQYVPGSHRWPVLRRDKLFQYLTPEEQISEDWPSMTQDFVAKLCEQEIDRRGANIVTYLPKKGSVLLWHSQLIHQGSKPKDLGRERKSFIAHYSSVQRRPDMPTWGTHTNGYKYYETSIPLEGNPR